MEKVLRDYILTVAKAYARANGLALATVSRRFHGTDSFFSDFAKGERTITLKKLQEMETAFKAQWPADLPWPNLPFPPMGVAIPAAQRKRLGKVA